MWCDVYVCAVEIPEVEINKDGIVIIDNESQKNASHRLPLAFNVYPFTCGILDNRLLCDPTQDESELLSGLITIVLNDNMELVHLHKPGGQSVSSQQLQKCLTMAEERALVLKKLFQSDSLTSTSSRPSQQNVLSDPQHKKKDLLFHSFFTIFHPIFCLYVFLLIVIPLTLISPFVKVCYSTIKKLHSCNLQVVDIQKKCRLWECLDNANLFHVIVCVTEKNLIIFFLASPLFTSKIQSRMREKRRRTINSKNTPKMLKK
ncbi:hypothetical protein RFI_04129 [Reticulomyxa filosa]|uniref:Exoribonuclease phosphorolytic domain-containing protein n=1 Tax=Reticulomyxa filosa TaxID=46433 RepID=X6P4I2_RETFI|nr:hypothetical protein RFI_04129 [Reticulomyxa filosa]|eukprot:ETO32979.1 hypothetical protein RFI_04129 [Reticulomyxa filosa]